MCSNFDIYNVKKLMLVDIRKYNGIEDNYHSWTFLGYDVVKVSNEGVLTSILAKEKVNYEVLKKMENTRSYDHENITVGDIRIKRVDTTHLGIFGKGDFVSMYDIKKWIDDQPQFYFLHYQPTNKETKVKKLKK